MAMSWWRCTIFIAAAGSQAATDAYAKWLLMRNCEAKIPGTQRYIFVKRGVFKSAAARPGATGAMMGHELCAGRDRRNRDAVCGAQALLVA